MKDETLVRRIDSERLNMVIEKVIREDIPNWSSLSNERRKQLVANARRRRYQRGKKAMANSDKA